MIPVVRRVCCSTPCFHWINGVKYWEKKKVWVFCLAEESRMTCNNFGSLILLLCLQSLHSAHCARALTLAAFHEDVTCGVSSPAVDNRTDVMKCYYLLYSKWYCRLTCHPPLKMKQGWCYRFGHCLSITVYWNELLHCMPSHTNYWMLIVTRQCGGWAVVKAQDL